jgi:opacity protein-like surface antigen
VQEHRHVQTEKHQEDTLKKTLFTLAALALLMSPAAFSADKRSSISASGNIGSTKTEVDTGFGTSSSTATSADVFLGYGFLLTDSIELGLELGTNITEDNTGNTTTNMLVGVSGKYYFRPVGEGGRLLPYAKIGLRVSTLDSDSASDTFTSYGWEAGGGLEFQVTENVSPFGEVSYSGLEEADDLFKTKALRFLVGIKLRF